MPDWPVAESVHYIFHYKENSFAQRNICSIMEEQEQRLRKILSVIPVSVPVKMDYWLCDTREELAELTGDEPSNGLFCWDDDDYERVSLYAVYNEKMQCTGYHEETHAITHFLNEPSSSALAEGVAVFMEETWWGVDIHLCTQLYYRRGNYVSVEALICNRQKNGAELFWSVDCAISYPVMGAFVAFLLSKGDTAAEIFLRLYQYRGDQWKKETEEIYQCSFSELEAEFITYICEREYTESEMEFAGKRLGLVS